MVFFLSLQGFFPSKVLPWGILPLICSGSHGQVLAGAVLAV
jgi:hypothetical protein